MSQWIKRTLAEEIRKRVNQYPILAVTGPRQSGKTTLLKVLFPDYTYVSLENPDNRSFASEDPNGFLKQYSGQVILDEVQRVPELFSYLQTAVDESGKMGQYILSGSQNFHLLQHITQSLAGRVALFRLLPLDTQELEQAGKLPGNYLEACIKGCYPAIYHRGIDPTDFYANYIRTYIEKDVTELINIRDLNSFRTFLGLCAARAGQLLNLTAMANECNISQPTAKSWLSILESSYVVFQLYPYHENFNKRLVKTPKLYFYDTGLLTHLLQIREQQELATNRLKGNIFENFIIANFQKFNENSYQHLQFYFWQDHNGLELDLLLKNASGFEVYEVKSTQTLSASLFKNLKHFAEIAKPQNVTPHLVYGGEESLIRSGVQVLPWKMT
ncbi:ATP-binding protein [Sphingobacterium sp. UT-1RO-CII-1]|uniref:ATP-binding protein n=1 Tax=Sphingobacterium sp. UT-1RO-CII-1 TaxID=2995225 RepID=UPI00227CB0CF|nr:ATP-binding protein [Sphingobacterium sp. UT-1RO-CII-1]MCY4780781.1 ATP-binding protein [Sphingobacterium sp. UT-1RO-CII-1]